MKCLKGTLNPPGVRFNVLSTRWIQRWDALMS